jgi:hypothetical protein
MAGKSEGLLGGDTYGPRKHDHRVEVDGDKYYEVQLYDRPTFNLKSGALGHVVVGLGQGLNEILIHSRLLEINGKDYYAAKEAEVQRALVDGGNSLKLLFERPESFEIRYTEQPFDFHFGLNEYGYQVTRIEQGGPASGIVPIGSLVTMVNGRSLIYNSATSLDKLLRDCTFPALITFEVFGQVVNERGRVILSQGRKGTRTSGEVRNKSGAQPMAVVSVPDEDSPLRENARKKMYPILGFCEWCAGFCTLLVGLLLLSALAVDRLMHVDTDWADDHEHIEHMSLIIKSSEIVGESATTPGFDFEFQDSSLCSMPPNSYFEFCMKEFGYGQIFGLICEEAKIWVGTNAWACTLALTAAFLILVGKLTYRDSALCGFGWCLLAMGIGFILTITGSIIQLVNAVEHVINGEKSICHCMLHDLRFQLNITKPEEFDSCGMSLSSSSILGSVAVAFWMPSLCLVCSSWMNTPKTCLYVGDH